MSVGRVILHLSYSIVFSLFFPCSGKLLFESGVKIAQGPWLLGDLGGASVSVGRLALSQHRIQGPLGNGRRGSIYPWAHKPTLLCKAGRWSQGVLFRVL